jgi:Predicted membrane protein (DUF2232)
MPYSLLIALGAGVVSAVVFASATTGPLFARMVLFLLTPLALFLAGLGLGPISAAVAGIAGAALVLAVGGMPAAIVFAVSQALPVLILVYLVSLNRPLAEGREWYPVGRLVIAAAVMAGVFSTLILFMLGGDVETQRILRDLLQSFVTNELPKMPDAPALAPADIEEAATYLLAVLPAATAISTMGSFLLNMWLAGRTLLRSSIPPARHFRWRW